MTKVTFNSVMPSRSIWTRCHQSPSPPKRGEPSVTSPILKRPRIATADREKVNKSLVAFPLSIARRRGISSVFVGRLEITIVFPLNCLKAGQTSSPSCRRIENRRRSVYAPLSRRLGGPKEGAQCPGGFPRGRQLPSESILNYEFINFPSPMARLCLEWRRGGRRGFLLVRHSGTRCLASTSRRIILSRAIISIGAACCRWCRFPSIESARNPPPFESTMLITDPDKLSGAPRGN